MLSVTSSRVGTARRAFAGVDYTVAGKSGTAQVVNIKENERYDASKLNERHRDNAMFVAFAPFESPEIVAIVVLENAGGGSSQAAPIIRKLLDEYFHNSSPVTSLQGFSF